MYDLSAITVCSERELSSDWKAFKNGLCTLCQLSNVFLNSHTFIQPNDLIHSAHYAYIIYNLSAVVSNLKAGCDGSPAV